MTCKGSNGGRIRCTDCRHYFVTWDARSPRGCRAMGMKSRQWPCDVVRKASGRTCLLYNRKPGRRPRTTGTDPTGSG